MKALSSSLQDYLEAVLFVEREKGEARVADVADFLNVKKPSVVKSLLKLKEEDLISQDPYGPVMLTKQGRKLAEKISRTHSVLKIFLSDVLCVEEDIADQDACRIEHVISPKTLASLTAFVEQHTKKRPEQK